MIFQVSKTIQLLLPALMPSWRFFDVIAPSPRIEFAVIEVGQESASEWQEFRSRAAKLTVSAMLKNLFWNPYWNETLFLVSCAERLIENHENDHSRSEITRRIEAGLLSDRADMDKGHRFQFRLLLIRREGQQLQKGVAYLSPVYQGTGDIVP